MALRWTEGDDATAAYSAGERAADGAPREQRGTDMSRSISVPTARRAPMMTTSAEAPDPLLSLPGRRTRSGMHRRSDSDTSLASTAAELEKESHAGIVAAAAERRQPGALGSLLGGGAAVYLGSSSHLRAPQSTSKRKSRGLFLTTLGGAGLPPTGKERMTPPPSPKLHGLSSSTVKVITAARGGAAGADATVSRVSGVPRLYDPESGRPVGSAGSSAAVGGGSGSADDGSGGQGVVSSVDALSTNVAALPWRPSAKTAYTLAFASLLFLLFIFPTLVSLFTVRSAAGSGDGGRFGTHVKMQLRNGGAGGSGDGASSSSSAGGIGGIGGWRGASQRSIDDGLPIAIVADLDKKSRVAGSGKPKWRSVLRDGVLQRQTDGKYSVTWAAEHELVSAYAEAGRGMELSELIVFNGALYTVDDRTGIVYEVTDDYRCVPRHVLMEGNGKETKGMKAEWASVKDGKLYIGSFGKEYTRPDGTIRTRNTQWIAEISSSGSIRHVDWRNEFEALRRATGTTFPGYLLHEAIVWSPAKRRWFFLPRRESDVSYTEEVDELKGTNLIISASETFSDIQQQRIGNVVPRRGFSSFRFVPGTDDNVIVALKSEETEALQTQDTYITVFDLDGNILLPDTLVPGGIKFEGLEFV